MSVVNQPMPHNLKKAWLDCPIGRIEIGVNLDTTPHTLWYVEIVDEQSRSHHNDVHPIIDLAISELSKYFEGQITDFSKLLQYQSNYGTDFQKQVWEALTKIPTGETWSYSELAKYIDNPKAVRAVGAANGKNPLAIVVPCHRVIGANGTLTGYAGGINNKQKLLDFEQEIRNKALKR